MKTQAKADIVEARLLGRTCMTCRFYRVRRFDPSEGNWEGTCEVFPMPGAPAVEGVCKLWEAYDEQLLTRRIR